MTITKRIFGGVWRTLFGRVPFDKIYRNINVRLTCALALFAMPTLLLGQTDLSLEEALAKGLANNFNVTIAQKNIEIAATQNSWGRAGALPSINLFATPQYSVNDQSQNPASFLQTEITNTSLNYGAQLNWTLFDGLAMFANKESFELLELQSEGNAQLVMENTAQAIVLAYYAAAVEKENLETIQTVLQLSKDRLQQAESNRELGTGTTFETLQFRSAVLNDSTAFLNGQLSQRNAIRNLNLLLNEKIETEWNLTTELLAPEDSYAIEDLKKAAFAENENLKIQFLNGQLAQQEIEVAKARFFPTVGLVANWSQNNSNIQIAEFERGGEVQPSASASALTTNYFANFSLNWNIYGGGNTRRAKQIAQINQEIATLNTSLLQESLDRDLRNALDQYNAQLAIYNLSNQNLKDAQLNIEIAEEKLRLGAINSFNYRDIQSAYLNIATAQQRSLLALLNTHTELLRLTGTILK